MPIIIPPAAFDVPAIVQVAAHAPAHPAASRAAAPPARGNTTPSPGPQPLGTGEGPEIVTPPAAPIPVPPPPTTNTSNGGKR